MCHECNKSFRTASDFGGHVKRVHSKQRSATVKNYPCNICEKSYENLFNYTVHMRSHTGQKPFQCLQCGNKFISKSSLLLHSQIHTDSRLFKCMVCCKDFKTRQGVRSHMVSHLSEEEKPHCCQQCEKRFARQKDLKYHLKYTHNSEKLYQCHKCNKSLKVLRNFKKHVGKCQGIHSSRIVSSVEDNVMEIGNMKFTLINEILDTEAIKREEIDQQKNIHNAYINSENEVNNNASVPLDYTVKEAKQEESYKCTDCHKSFKSNAQLLIHRRTHTGERPFQCIICDQRFTTKGNLSSHFKYHTTLKLHKCTICSKGFKTKQCVVKHMPTHLTEEEKQHHCPVCGKCFARRRNLKLHTATHNTEKLYQCGKCDQSFTTNEYLKRHIRKNHRDESVIRATFLVVDTVI